MTTLTTRMAAHHRDCDGLFADADNAVVKAQWPIAMAAFRAFRTALEQHLWVEENTIFPRLEAVTGISDGPTRMMRAEHTHMRSALECLETALVNQDGEAYAEESETLLILMQQHNLKEESVLYPMCDRRLAAEVG